MSDFAELLKAIASLLWVVLGVAALLSLRKIISTRGGALSKLGIGPSGVTMEFAEAKIEQAVNRGDPHKRDAVGEVAKRSVATRLQRNADLLAQARIMWVDDHPDHNAPILDLLRRFGAAVETPRSNQEALALLKGSRYDVIISDVARDDEGPGSNLKGVELAEKVYSGWRQPVLLFTARFDPTTLPGFSDTERLELVQKTRDAVFATTNRMDEALHYILDVLER